MLIIVMVQRMNGLLDTVTERDLLGQIKVSWIYISLKTCDYTSLLLSQKEKFVLHPLIQYMERFLYFQ